MPKAKPVLKADLSQAPMAALVLGFGGLVPFFAGALGGWFLPPQLAGLAISAQFYYAAFILGFLGAVHWGLTLAESAETQTWRRYGWAVLPSLIAWVIVCLGVVFQSPAMLIRMFALLIAAFLLAYIVDRRMIIAGHTPLWYLPLRLYLTVFAILSLLSSIVRLVRLIYDPEGVLSFQQLLAVMTTGGVS